MHDQEAMEYQDSNEYYVETTETEPGVSPGNREKVSVDTAQFKSYATTMRKQLRNWEFYSLFDAAMQSLSYEWYQNYAVDLWPKSYTLENKTRVDICKYRPTDQNGSSK
jgi:hypothetical protein